MESIGALAISKVTTDGKSAFLATGSQDRTIKLWSLEDIFSSSGSDPNLDHDEPNKLKSLLTQKAHEKDINSLDISPNNRLLATGSQDKTAKIFEIEHQKGGRITVNLVGTLKGHKRGIWNVKFSGVEKIIATASGDKSIKLWNLDDYSCIKVRLGSLAMPSTNCCS
jgi:U3 small nucleolar RNA-associated protein 13